MDPVQEQPPVKKNFHRSLLVVLVVIAAVEFLLLMNKNGQFPPAASTKQEAEVESPLQEGVMEGVFSLKADKVATVGAPLTFTVAADSNKRKVVGFDTIVEYDETAFTLGSVRSSLKGFTATSSTRKKYLEVTSIKEPQEAVTPVLKNTEVLSFTLTPRKVGNYKVNLVDRVGESSTKYIDSETQVYLPKVNGVTVTVK
ncbi:MAG: hypothetical protein WBC38_04365 [Microgenomates group bacterium]|jgi:hypothetical protein